VSLHEKSKTEDIGGHYWLGTMDAPILKIVPCKEASQDWVTRALLLVAALGIPAVYLLQGGGIQIFESGDWVFVLALPACALFLALDQTTLDERRIAHMIGFGGYGITYGSVAWADVVYVELRSTNRGRILKLVITATSGVQLAFSVPSSGDGSSRFREIDKYFNKRAMLNTETARS
jgi:hypothetical protein